MTSPSSDQTSSDLPQSAVTAREAALRTVATELKTARARAGLSVAELHRRSGISRTVLQGYEAARFGPGTIELKKLCEELGVTPNRILFGSEQPLDTKSTLESYIGPLDQAMNIAKLGMIMQVLTATERNAVIALIEAIATPRLGGVEQIKVGMEGIGLVLSDQFLRPDVLKKFAEEVVDGAPENLKDQMEALTKKAETLKKPKK